LELDTGKFIKAMEADLGKLKRLSAVICSSVSGPQATTDSNRSYYYEKAESMITSICAYFEIPVDPTYPEKSLKTSKGRYGREPRIFHEATIQTLSRMNHPLHGTI